MVARVVNFLPMLSYEVARRTGLGENVARSALVLATVGDSFVPCVFSVGVIAASAIVRPMAPVETVQDALRSIRTKVDHLQQRKQLQRESTPQPEKPPQPEQPPQPEREDWY
eukprot:TRINITY_DN4408_c0_g1_i2.p3 TRINITY_DN4408_c0_g1~~TRINITY_DN4408_c0_g1_i2.p3  ORF type:complete len:112 (-),score=37.75 TRINITY_DN4408_c0_g1_i2:71-406(-)